MAATISQKEIEEEIRKLRKKLKQIANLERKSHILTHKEKNKIGKKSCLRKELHSLLPENEIQKERREVNVKDSSKSKTTHTGKHKSPKPSSSEFQKSTGNKVKAVILNKSENTGTRYSLPTEEENISSNALQQDLSTGEDSGEDEFGFDEQFDVLPPPSPPPPDNPTEPPPNTQNIPNKANPVIQNSPPPTGHPLKKKWRDKECLVEYLEGHNDLVTSLDVCGVHLVTACRDTTIKVWNLENGFLLRSLGGHTESVTCVVILPHDASIELSEELEINDEDNIIISGSTDCSFKLWSLQTGSIIKSVYTYNTITSLDYNYNTHLLVTSSDGGKLELWDLISAENIHSIRNDEDAITGVVVKRNKVYSGSVDGIIKIYEIREKKLCCVFESHDVKTSHGSHSVNRHIRCLRAVKDIIYYGDDAVNIKALDWKKGIVTKYSNHTEEFAATDAVCVYNNLLISSSYDLDHGLGYYNVRELPSCEYLFSIDDGDTDRITCIACTTLPNDDLIIITGGLHLKTWQFTNTSRVLQDHRTRTKLIYIEQFSKSTRDSDSDESEEDEVSEEDDVDVGMLRNSKYLKLDADNGSKSNTWSWCNIL